MKKIFLAGFAIIVLAVFAAQQSGIHNGRTTIACGGGTNELIACGGGTNELISCGGGTNSLSCELALR
jgi:hypothetical protein